MGGLFSGTDPFRNDPYRDRSIKLGQRALPSGEGRDIKLYLISPYRKDTAIIRPLVYNNNVDLQDDVLDLLKRRNNEYLSSMSGLVKNGFFLDKTRQSHSALLPGTDWHEFRSPVLSDDSWMFILVMTNAPAIGNRYNPSSGNKLIYTGFIIGDDPIFTSWGKTTLNEEALFFVTHHTAVIINRSISPKLGGREIAATDRDVDVLSQALLDMNESDRDNREYLLDPGVVMESASQLPEITGMDTIDSPAMASLQLRDNGLAVEDSLLNSPKHHVNRVMAGLFRTMTESDRQEILSGSAGMGSLEGYTDRYAKENMFRNFLAGSKASAVRGLPMDKSPFSFRSLLNSYPNIAKNIEVLDIDVDEQQYGLSDIEKAPTPTSIFSALLKSAIPPIMAEFGISDCAFRWASSNPAESGIARLNREPIVKVQDFRTIIDEPQDISRARFHEMLDQLEQYVFSTIIETCGEFEVYVHYAQGDRIVVQLQLRDLTDEINDSYVVGQNYLGGVISPLLGSEENYTSHRETLHSFLDLADIIPNGGDIMSGGYEPEDRRPLFDAQENWR